MSAEAYFERRRERKVPHFVLRITDYDYDIKMLSPYSGDRVDFKLLRKNEQWFVDLNPFDVYVIISIRPVSSEQ